MHKILTTFWCIFTYARALLTYIWGTIDFLSFRHSFSFSCKFQFQVPNFISSLENCSTFSTFEYCFTWIEGKITACLPWSMENRLTRPFCELYRSDHRKPKWRRWMIFRPSDVWTKIPYSFGNHSNEGKTVVDHLVPFWFDICFYSILNLEKIKTMRLTSEYPRKSSTSCIQTL